MHLMTCPSRSLWTGPCMQLLSFWHCVWHRGPLTAVPPGCDIVLQHFRGRKLMQCMLSRCHAAASLSMKCCAQMVGNACQQKMKVCSSSSEQMLPMRRWQRTLLSRRWAWEVVAAAAWAEAWAREVVAWARVPAQEVRFTPRACLPRICRTRVIPGRRSGGEGNSLMFPCWQGIRSRLWAHHHFVPEACICLHLLWRRRERCLLRGGPALVGMLTDA